ncbi:MAG: hypothetical protein ABW098_10520 [Candidatus Thiodiazotropha sp.]
METRLFTCLIEEQNDKEPFVQVYWANAEHLGTAIELVLDAALNNGLNNPIARECDLYDINNLQQEVMPDTESKVFWSTSRYFFPPEKTFSFSHGIISSCLEGEHDIDEIVSGYSSTAEGGLITIEVNVEHGEILNLYGKIINLHSPYKVFWYVLHDHWNDEETDRFLVNEDINTADKIISHISENKADSVENGYVTLTAYLEEGSTNISITDHKRVVVRTYSELVAARVRKHLNTVGYKEFNSLVSIDNKIYHWHYRSSTSKSKRELEESLKRLGFVDWQPNKPD